VVIPHTGWSSSLLAGTLFLKLTEILIVILKKKIANYTEYVKTDLIFLECDFFWPKNNCWCYGGACCLHHQGLVVIEEYLFQIQVTLWLMISQCVASYHWGPWQSILNWKVLPWQSFSLYWTSLIRGLFCVNCLGHQVQIFNTLLVSLSKHKCILDHYIRFISDN